MTHAQSVKIQLQRTYNELIKLITRHRFPFKRLAMNIFGSPNGTKEGNKYVLIVMDYATKWTEIFTQRNVTKETINDCHIELITRLGIPGEILSDNDSNIILRTMKQFCECVGIHHIQIIPYHFHTGGMVKKFSFTLKSLLRKLVQKNTKVWDKCLPFVMWLYRGTVHKITVFTPMSDSSEERCRYHWTNLIHFGKRKIKQTNWR